MGFKSFFIRQVAKLVYRIVHHPAYVALENEKTNSLKYSFKHLAEPFFIMEPYMIKKPQYMSIGKNFSALFNLRLEAWDEYEGQKFTPELIIGDNVCFNSDCHIGCINKVVIGNNVLLASRVYISDHFHGKIDDEIKTIPPTKRKLFSKSPVIIEDNVWIGEGVCIMPGVVIGKNSIVGANAVVTKSFPANSIIGGVPAKLLKSL
jgi:acetyltransferase-like isoleucine patch superfamily enzyme